MCNSFWIHFPKDPSNVGSSPAVKGIHCPLGPPLLLIPLYTLINFLYNGAGLVMTKHGSAVLRYISYAMILSITTIVGAPIFNERVTIFTYIGLGIVIVGFGLYQSNGQIKKKKTFSSDGMTSSLLDHISSLEEAPLENRLVKEASNSIATFEEEVATQVVESSNFNSILISGTCYWYGFGA